MTANLELCKELYEVSGWKDTHSSHRPTPSNSHDNYRVIDMAPNIPTDIPAYDLGYLLRKLPQCHETNLEHTYLKRMTSGEEKPGDRV